MRFRALVARAKKAALLFDRIAVFGLSSLRSESGGWDGGAAWDFPGGMPEYGWEARFDWMLEQGLMYDEKITATHHLGHRGVTVEYSSPMDTATTTWKFNDRLPLHDYWASQLLSSAEYGSAWRKNMPESLGQVQGPLASTCRYVAGAFRTNPDVDPVVMGQSQNRFANDPVVEEGRDLALYVVLNALPEPLENTPWQDILNFRQDPDARVKLARLRTWMTTVAKENTSPAAVEDELTSLLADYEAHMKLHHIRTERGVLEAILTTTAEVAQAFVTMKWGSAVKALFDVSRAEIALLEAEKSAPGRAVAYIAQLQSRFS